MITGQPCGACLLPRTKVPRKPPLSRPALADLVPSWQRSLDARNRSPRTLQTYLEGLRLFDRYLAAQGMPRAVAGIRREHVEAFIAGILAKWKPATANNRYRAVQQFFKWAVEEGEIQADSSPMKNLRPPKVPEREVPVLRTSAWRAELAAPDPRCAG